MKFGIAFVLLTVFSPLLSAQAPDQLKSLSISRQTKDSQGCIYIDSSPDQYTTLWGNICDRPMQFTIEWSGNRPAQKLIYHINSRSDRQVARVDTKGVLIDEAPPRLGSGERSKLVEVRKKDIGFGQTMLMLANGEDHPVFIMGKIAISKNGKQVRACDVALLVAGSGQENACVLFGSEEFTPHFEAELDPN